MNGIKKKNINAALILFIFFIVSSLGSSPVLLKVLTQTTYYKNKLTFLVSSHKMFWDY